jgi:hypothetical protein
MTKFSLLLGLAVLCSACRNEAPSSAENQIAEPAGAEANTLAQNLNKWFPIADELTDCSELAFVAAEIFSNSRQADIAVGLDRAIEEQQILSARLRLLAIKVATFDGASEQDYIKHLVARGPQYARFIANPSSFDQDAAAQSKLNSCMQTINSDPRILEQRNIVFQMSPQQLMN